MGTNTNTTDKPLTRTQKLSLWCAFFATVYLGAFATPDLNTVGAVVFNISGVLMVLFAVWATWNYSKTAR
jgi:hypothetical protein